MKITVYLTEEEKTSMLKELILSTIDIPEDFELTECYLSIGEFTFTKRQDFKKADNNGDL